jgi:hypothetical protein
VTLLTLIGWHFSALDVVILLGLDVYALLLEVEQMIRFVICAGLALALVPVAPVVTGVVLALQLRDERRGML